MSIGIPPVPVDWEAYTYSPASGNLDSKDGVDYTYAAQTPGTCPGGSRSIPHAASSIDTPITYTYDCNGNMTSRILGGIYPPVYNFSYDAENRLTAVSGEATATFVYDGDGNRVKATVNSVTVVYIGIYYEWSGTPSTMVSYYYAGSVRIAMRVGSGPGATGLSWLVGDHLGSTSIVADNNGASIGGVTYKPFGETESTWGTVPTKRLFTGQILEASLGLYFFNARWYDGSLGRFIQPDTIVPGLGDPKSFDRFAYTLNNPVNLIDPSGHGSVASCRNSMDYYGCNEIVRWSLFAYRYGITISGKGWTEADYAAVREAVERHGEALSSVTGENAWISFRKVYGSMDFEMADYQCPEGCWGRSLGKNNIRLYRHYTDGEGVERNTIITPQLVVHELIHSFENIVGGNIPSNAVTAAQTAGNLPDRVRGKNGEFLNYYWGFATLFLGAFQQSNDPASSEEFADMGLGWTYGVWENSIDGQQRADFMTTNMAGWVQQAIRNTSGQ